MSSGENEVDETSEESPENEEGEVSETNGESEANENGFHARIAVRPRPECPIRTLSEQTTVRQFTPGRRSVRPPRMTLERGFDAGSEQALEEHPIEILSWVGDVIVCELPTVGPASNAVERNGSVPNVAAAGTQSEPPDCEQYGGGSCLAYGFAFLPVSPHHVQWIDGWLHLSIATTEYAELQASIEKLESADLDVDLRQVIRGSRANESTAKRESPAVFVDLSTLTDRQREVAATAVEMGYFTHEGATAGEVAAELEIAKSTVSRHLRVVTQKIFSQLFP